MEFQILSHLFPTCSQKNPSWKIPAIGSQQVSRFARFFLPSPQFYPHDEFFVGFFFHLFIFYLNQIFPNAFPPKSVACGLILPGTIDSQSQRKCVFLINFPQKNRTKGTSDLTVSSLFCSASATKAEAEKMRILLSSD